MRTTSDYKFYTKVLICITLLLTPMSGFFVYLFTASETKANHLILFIIMALWGTNLVLFFVFYDNYRAKVNMRKSILNFLNEVIPLIMENKDVINHLLENSVFNFIQINKNLNSFRFDKKAQIINTVCFLLDDIYRSQINHLFDGREKNKIIN